MKNFNLYTLLLFLFVILPFLGISCIDSEKRDFIVSETDWEYSPNNSPFTWSPIPTPLLKDSTNLRGNYFLRCKFLSPSNLNLSLLTIFNPINPAMHAT